MDKVLLYLLRGVCQLPGYVAYEKGFFLDNDLSLEIQILPTAWIIPEVLGADGNRFAVIPWTRVAAAVDSKLVLLCGSGIEEAAVVLRSGLRPSEVRRVAVPVAGGMKDLTAMALLKDLGWSDAELCRQPSGDGAILALVGQAADAASMVEPYATMLEGLGIGKVIKRTGDIWPGAPGCSLSARTELVRENPDLLQRVVTAYVKGAQFVTANPQEAAGIGSRYVGVNAQFILEALQVNRPDPLAIRNEAPMQKILSLMKELGYLSNQPSNYTNMSFLNKALTSLAG